MGETERRSEQMQRRGGVGVVVPEDVGRWVYVCLSERSLMSNQIAKIEKTSNTQNWQRCETNRTLKLCWWEYTAILEYNLVVALEVKHILTI